MRPIASQQDPLRYPLNVIFGTQAHVRLLRVMANEVEGPITASDIAKRAGLTVPGAKKALRRLLRSGFISRVGGGRKQQYEIRRSDRLMQIALELFRAEKNRFEQLLTGIKNEIRELTPLPNAVWIHATSEEIDEPLILGMLHDSRHLTQCARQLRSGLDTVEKDFDLTIELESLTKADLPDLDLKDATVLYGIISETLTGSVHQETNKIMTHLEKDRQLRLISQKLAGLLKQDASLVRRAKDHIDRLLKEDQGMAAGDLEEWRNILDKFSIQRIAHFLSSSSERAIRLRQSNPFFAILNTVERTQLAEVIGERK